MLVAEYDRQRGVLMRIATLILFAATALAEPTDFEATTRQALASCAPEVQLEGVDCTASPCVARFTDPDLDWARIASCPVWKDAYGSTVSTFGGRAECADGTLKPFFLMAPEVAGIDGMKRVMEVRDAFPCGDEARRKR